MYMLNSEATLVDVLNDATTKRYVQSAATSSSWTFCKSPVELIWASMRVKVKVRLKCGISG